MNRAREIRGFLVGTIVKVGKDGLVVRISRILTAKRNEAKGSRSLKGKDVPVRFARRPSEKQLGQLQELRRAGGTVAAEVFRLPDRDGLFTQQVKSLGEVERKE